VPAAPHVPAGLEEYARAPMHNVNCTWRCDGAVSAGITAVGLLSSRPFLLTSCVLTPVSVHRRSLRLPSYSASPRSIL